MTELATEDGEATLPPPPSRRVRAPSGAGAVIAAAACAALLAGAGWFAWGPARLNAALDGLTAQDAGTRKDAQERLVALREAAVGRLGELAASRNPLQRRRAVRAAAALDLKDDASALEIVKKAALDPDAAVREDALACLRQFTNAGSTEALKTLLDLARQTAKEGASVPPGLVEALGESAPPSDQGRDLLADKALELLAAPHPNPRLRSALLRSVGMALLGRSGEPSAETARVLHALLASAADPDPAVRAALDAVLRQLQGPKAIPFALGALEHPDPWVRLWGETTLRTATGKGAGSDPLGPETERKAAAERWKPLVR